MESFLIAISKYFLVIIKFPLWWYSVGFFNFFKATWNSINGFDEVIGFSIWLKNIFTPLFHQYDLAGRVVSFFLRVVNIIIRGLIMLVLTLIHLALLIAWLMGPIILVYIFITHAIN